MGGCCSKNRSDSAELPDPVRQENHHHPEEHTVLPAQITVEVPTPEALEASVAAEPKDLIRMGDREDLSNKEDTMFLTYSHISMKLMKTSRQRHSSARVLPEARSSSPVAIKKSNSCSTIYLDDSTVSLPNLKATLKCVSLAVFYIVKGRDRTREPRTLEIFDEKAHPLTREPVPSHYADFTPDHKVIYKFVKTLFHAAQLNAENAIITQIYLERLLDYAELDLHPCNWKRILLGAILLASKVWDDQAVWNVDYCQILRDIPVEDMNELERVYLVNIHYNINVSSSMYAKYYFDLRVLAEENGLSFPNEFLPLTKERAKKLEALSHIDAKSLKGVRRSSSLEPLSSKHAVILS